MQVLQLLSKNLLAHHGLHVFQGISRKSEIFGRHEVKFICCYCSVEIERTWKRQEAHLMKRHKMTKEEILLEGLLHEMD